MKLKCFTKIRGSSAATNLGVNLHLFLYCFDIANIDTGKNGVGVYLDHTICVICSCSALFLVRGTSITTYDKEMHIHSLTLSLCRLLIIFVNGLCPEQDRQKSGSKPFDTLIVFLKEIFEKVNFEIKKSA